MSKVLRERVFGSDIIELIGSRSDYPRMGDIEKYAKSNGYYKKSLRMALRDFWDGYWFQSPHRHPLCSLDIRRAETWREYKKRVIIPSMAKACDGQVAAADQNARSVRLNRSAIASKFNVSMAKKMMECSGLCPCCGCDMILGYDYELDHIYPLSLGGTNEDWNLWFMCGDCNRKKSNEDPFIWAKRNRVKLPDAFLSRYSNTH